jgi:hypothetical protein
MLLEQFKNEEIRVVGRMLDQKMASLAGVCPAEWKR